MADNNGRNGRNGGWRKYFKVADVNQLGQLSPISGKNNFGLDITAQDLTTKAVLAMSLLSVTTHHACQKYIPDTQIAVNAIINMKIWTAIAK